MDATHTVDAGPLTVGYLDVGPPEGRPVILLHGFPYDVHSYAEVSNLLARNGFRCVIPYLRGYGPTRFHDASTMRSGQQATLGADLLALLDALSIDTALVAGYDWGGRAACIVAALHPDRVTGLVSCGQGYNIQNIAAASLPATPAEEARYWYQYYFHSDRGRAGLAADRRALCRFLWATWSPARHFHDAVFERSAAAFDNPDFVDVVVHSYRHRFGLVPGDPAYAAIEADLARTPDIPVPTIVLQGTVDPPANADADRAHFTGRYERRLVSAGHNVPQEAPHAFADAVLSAAR